MFDKLDDLLIRFEEVLNELGEPGVTDNQEHFQKLMKEQSDLQPIVDAYREYKKNKETIQDSLSMLEEEKDEDMREMLKEELSEAKKNVEELEHELKILLLPKDPNDNKNVIVEIRAGAGGDEAALFAAGYKAVPMDQISVPFHYKTYEASRTTKLSTLHNIVRKLTLNGYLLPAKHIRIVSMAQVTFPAVWRAKKIVFYDVTANKAFECERSWAQAVAKFFQVLGLTIQIDFKYNKAKKDFLKRGNEIKNIQFWSKYLGLDKQ